jgi:hypothetical protein
MIQAWKAPHICKGLLSSIPMLDRWRLQRASTGGSNSARYCYSVWLRHLSILGANGFRVTGARVGELGPGDSIGTGLAALLSGAKSYIALDVVPFSARADLLAIFQNLVALFSSRAAIPNHQEFPGVRPSLESYAFPYHLVDYSDFGSRVANLRRKLIERQYDNGFITYRVPWNSADVIDRSSLDLIFSQAALEHVDSLEATYQAMSTWLAPGGYASHVIDFSAHHLSPYWNGHWAYADFEWRLVRGRREFLLNREPLSTHLQFARESGLDVLQIVKNYDDSGLLQELLAPRFQNLTFEDRRTRGAVLVLRKCK